MKRAAMEIHRFKISLLTSHPLGGIMKARKHLVIGLLSIFGIVSLAGCHPGSPFRFRQETGEETAARRIDYVIDKLTKHLDLDTSQEKRLRVMAETFRQETEDLRKGHGESKEEVMALLSQEKVDAEEVQELITAKMEKFKPMIALFSANVAELHALLTKEQRIRLIEKIKAHEHKGCRFNDRW